MRSRLGLPSRRRREREDEPRAAIGRREAQRAAQPARELRADREAEAEAAARVALAGAAAPEAVEDALALLCRHARPAVLHHEGGHAGLAGHGHLDRLARRGEALRIVEQDAQDLRDAAG